MTYFEQIKNNYLDKNAHVVQADRNGGDSLNRIGATYACLAPQDIFVSFDRSSIESIKYRVAMYANEHYGRYCRNPEPGRWFSNYDNTTRDQIINLEAAWALMGDTARARRHFAQRIKRGMFHFNTQDDGYDSGLPLKRKFPDPPTPVELATIIRAGKYWALTPLLYILDWFLVLDCAITRRLNERNLYDGDNNLLPAVLAALEVYPTFIGRIAKYFYAKSDADVRLLDYHAEGPSRNGIAPLGDLMASTFRRKIQGFSE